MDSNAIASIIHDSFVLKKKLEKLPQISGTRWLDRFRSRAKLK